MDTIGVVLVGCRGSIDSANASVPREELVEAMDGMVRNVGQKVGEIGFLIEIIAVPIKLYIAAAYSPPASDQWKR